MASRGDAVLAFLVIALCGLSRVSATLEDGIPRPANFPDLPTATYDNTPVLTGVNGLPSDCIWYGFANELYASSTGASCLTALRKALTNATVNPPSTMHPYVYYTLKRLMIASSNSSYCYQGCFNLGSATSPVPAPSLVPGAPGQEAVKNSSTFSPPATVISFLAAIVALFVNFVA